MSQQRSRTPNVPVGGRTVTRRAASRRAREARRQRIAIGAAVGAMLLVALIIGLPLLKRTLWDPSRTLAVVGEQRLTRADYDKQQRLNNILGSDPGVLAQTFELYRQDPDQFRESIASAVDTADESGAAGVTAASLDPMIDDAVLVQSAGQAGADLSEAKVDQKLMSYLYPAGAPKEPAAGATPTAGPTVAPTAAPAAGGTAPAVTPTAGPPSDQQVEGFFDTLDDSLGISREDYERLAVEPAMVREQYLAKNKPKAAPQVHVRHILVSDRQAAEKVLQDLKKGVRFEVLARERSQDTSNAPKGGDLGWAPREAYVAPFADAAFKLTKPGQLSSPVQTTFGWHIIQLLERDDNRPLNEQQQDQIAQSKLQSFIKQQRERLQREGQLDIAIPPTPVPTAVPTGTPEPVG